MSDVLHPTPQTPEHVHEVPEHELHELPEGVVVPDDLSTLEGHEAPRRGPRWLYWLAGVVVVGAGAVILVSVLGDDGTEQPETPASDIVEANRTATLQDLAATEAAVTFDTSHIRDLTAEATASDIVEANRTATLQDLAAARSNPGPNADLPPDVVNN